MEKNNRVKAVISLDAVEQNFREMRKNIAEDTKMIAVVKADAYGHGAVPIAHLIEDYDYIWGFAAATAEEAVHLRQAGITKPILILGIVFDEYFPELVQYDIRPAVCEYDEAKKLSDEAVLQKFPVSDSASRPPPSLKGYVQKAKPMPYFSSGRISYISEAFSLVAYSLTERTRTFIGRPTPISRISPGFTS